MQHLRLARPVIAVVRSLISFILSLFLFSWMLCWCSVVCLASLFSGLILFATVDSLKERSIAACLFTYWTLEIFSTEHHTSFVWTGKRRIWWLFYMCNFSGERTVGNETNSDALEKESTILRISDTIMYKVWWAVLSASQSHEYERAAIARSVGEL